MKLIKWIQLKIIEIKLWFITKWFTKPKVAFRTYGKLAAAHDPQGRTLHMAKYAVNLSDPPKSYSSTARIMGNLKLPIVSLFPIDGNSTYGCCVVAGSAHDITAWNGLINKENIPSSCEVIREYFKLTGGIDSGLVELDTLKIWKNDGLLGNKIIAFVRNDIKNIKQIKQSIYLFGSVYIGFSVQEHAVEDFEIGKTWTDEYFTTGGGHCVVVVSYDEDGVDLLTWGGIQRATWSWWLKFVDESWTILPEESQVEFFHPEFPFEILQRDIIQVSN